MLFSAFTGFLLNSDKVTKLETIGMKKLKSVYYLFLVTLLLTVYYYFIYLTPCVRKENGSININISLQFRMHIRS